MNFEGFDRDDVNTRKLIAHDLAPEDIEGLFDEGRPVFMEHACRPERSLALGFVPDGRFVLVVFEYDKETRWVRVVTAYEAEHERWWKIYQRKAEGPKPR